MSLEALSFEWPELLKGQDLGQICFSATQTELLHMLKLGNVAREDFSSFTACKKTELNFRNASPSTKAI